MGQKEERMIPKTLDECFEELSKSEGLEKFKDMPEEHIIGAYHHGLGTWMRNEWGLWDEKSDLHKHFKAMGLFHADDMSGLILLSFHRKVNEKELKTEEQIENYKQYWRRE
jgi:hypothetical protein